ncbi:hypothetical protein B0H21DRAFT_676735, partial [Amylocystis lapponica]
KDPHLNSVLRKRLEWMKALLWIFIDPRSTVHGVRDTKWIAASAQVAATATRGPWFARQLRKWVWSFIRNRSDIPDNIYGTWNTSVIEDEDIASAIQLHLQGLGKYIRAMDIVTYLNSSEVRRELNLKKSISLATAKRWMRQIGYRWSKSPRGQYVDGHE